MPLRLGEGASSYCLTQCFFLNSFTGKQKSPCEVSQFLSTDILAIWKPHCGSGAQGGLGWAPVGSDVPRTRQRD